MTLLQVTSLLVLIIILVISSSLLLIIILIIRRSPLFISSINRAFFIIFFFIAELCFLFVCRELLLPGILAVGRVLSLALASSQLLLDNSSK